MSDTENISLVKKWLISIRPFALPASTMPVIFGTALAAIYGGYPFKPYLFLMAFFAMVILHSGANILSDIKDFSKGLDIFPTPVSGGIVRGILSVKEATLGAVILIFTGAAIGVILAWLTGWYLLVIGGIGLIIGIFYTFGGKLALKYHGLGDLAVFLDFGILGSLGAWYVQTETLSWIPVIWAIPMSLLVVGILHANNWRDIVNDKKGDIFTIASLLGDKGSLRYYAFLIFTPFVLILVYVFIPQLWKNELPVMPYAFLITLLAMPMAFKLLKRAKDRREPKAPLDFIALDGATSKLNLSFGVLCTLALFIDYIIKSYA